MFIDYHLHPMGHGEGSHKREILEPFFQEAVKKGIRELGISDHERYYREFDYRRIKEIALEYPDLTIRMGLELSYLPACREEMGRIVKDLEPDYVIGSLHHLDGWMFDHPDYIGGYSNWDLHHLYQRYFSLMEELVQQDYFHIIGHLDLIKVFGFRPLGDYLAYVEPVLLEIVKNNKTIELNTSGYRKPAQEFYPSTCILKACQELGIPLTLGSDAHLPEHVGSMFHEAKELLLELGYTKLATFSKGERAFLQL